MAQPAPQKTPGFTPDAVITLNNEGEPSTDPANIPSGGSVQIVNPSTNTNNFLVQLWDRENKKHPVISVYLPVGDDVIYVDDPERDCRNAVCPYNILVATDAGEVGPPATGGNNRIIVGSGNNE